MLHFNKVIKIESASDTDRLNKVLFLDAQNGIICGGSWYKESLILVTHDGGTTWQRNANSNEQQMLFGATTGPGGSYYCVGFEGKLWYSNDTGKSWKFEQIEHNFFRDIAVMNDNTYFVVGGISFSEGIMTRVDSSYHVWSRDAYPWQFNCIRMKDSLTGYICGFGNAYRTDDGGKTWTLLNVKGDNFMSMDLVGDDIYMCGSVGSVYHSNDKGNSWEVLRNGNDITKVSYHLYDIKFSDALHGWAVGEKGVVIYTQDGGHNWSQYTTFTSQLLTSISVANDNIIVVGDNGTIYKLIP